MADIFVSYARADRERVSPIVAGLAAQGWSVWWDPEIAPGQEFDSLINRELRAAKAVIVVWTPASVESRWVRGEARIASERGILIPVRFNNAELPIDARSLHTTDLDDWNEDVGDPQFQGLLRALKTFLTPSTAAPSVAPAAIAPRPRPRPRLWLMGAGTVALVTAISIAIFAFRDTPKTHQNVVANGPGAATQGTPTASIKPAKLRLAVMPFRNLSPDPANTFFTDGMHEEILSTLANHAPGLEIISATTMLTYKDKPVTIEQVAKDLACTHVLEGSVRREGNAVRLTLQLIDARTDDHVWAKDYDRTLTKALTLQSEVAGEVASELSAQLSGGVAGNAAPTKSTEAYDFYLQARVLIEETNPGIPSMSNQNIVKASKTIENLLSQAIAADPSYGLAYAERARTRAFGVAALLPPFALADPREFAAARDDLQMAATLLGNDHPRVIVSRAVIAFTSNTGVEKDILAEFDKPLADADFLDVKANLYSRIGRLPEAVEITRGRVALDPANLWLLMTYQSYLQAARRPAEALKVLGILMSRPDAPPIAPLLRAQLIFDWTGDITPLKAAISHSGSGVDPDALIFFKCSALFNERRYDELKTLVASHPSGMRLFEDGQQLATNFPVAAVQGEVALLTEDKTLGKAAGELFLKTLHTLPASIAHRVDVLMLEGMSHTFAGETVKALKAARESAKMLEPPPCCQNFRGPLAMVLAWSGAGDEAVDLLEQVSAGDWSVGPAMIARNPLYTVPLASNERFQVLKAKLEAQMAENARLLNARAQ